MSYQRSSRALATIGLAMAVAACTGQQPAAVRAPESSPVAQEPVTVRAGALWVLAEAGQFLAQSHGYFAQEGLAIDFVKLDPSTVFATLVAGQVDLAGFGLDPGLFGPIQRGVDFRIVATEASHAPNANAAYFVVRKDLIDSGRVRDYADLKGLRIGIPSHGNTAEYALARAMEAGGLAPNDAELVVMNAFPAVVTGLASHAIDVGFLLEPLATTAVQDGSGVKWKGMGDIVPDIQAAVVVFSPGFAAQRDLATRWTAGYLRGMREYNDAFVKNTHRQQTVEALAGTFAIALSLFDNMGFAHIDPNGKLNLASMEDLMHWYVRMGYLSAPVDLAKVVDTSFTQAALAELGEYR